MEIATFNVPSVSCSACSSKIEENVRELKGITNVYSDLKKPADKSRIQPFRNKPARNKKNILPKWAMK